MLRNWQYPWRQFPKVSKGWSIFHYFPAVQNFLTTFFQPFNLFPALSSGPASPLIACPQCHEPMFRFNAAQTGRPYVKCVGCDIIRSERDTRIPECYCELTARLRTNSRTGQQFRSCGRLVSDPSRCNFTASA
jgi:hypothetical protein